MSFAGEHTFKMGGGTAVSLSGGKTRCRAGNAGTTVRMQYDEALSVEHGDFRYVVHVDDSIMFTREMPSEFLPSIMATLLARSELIGLGSGSDAGQTADLEADFGDSVEVDDPPPNEVALVDCLSAAPAAPPRPLVLCSPEAGLI